LGWKIRYLFTNCAILLLGSRSPLEVDTE